MIIFFNIGAAVPVVCIGFHSKLWPGMQDGRMVQKMYLFETQIGKIGCRLLSEVRMTYSTSFLHFGIRVCSSGGMRVTLTFRNEFFALPAGH